MDDPDWSVFLEAAFIAVLEAADEGIVVFDRDGRCRMIGRRAGEIFGVEPAAHVGRTRAEVLRALSQSCEEPEAFLEAVGANDLLEPPRVIAEIDLRQPRPRSVAWTSFPVLREGTVWGRLGLVRDVTRERSAERSLKQLQAKLQEYTPVDALTGVSNMRRFREELDREHGRSTRAWDSYAILRFDVDGMAELNGDYGFPVGDSVLEHVAGRLKAVKREYDVLARLEADEFVLLLPGADAVAATAVAERLAASVRQHDFELDGARGVTVSIGGAVWVPPSAETAEDILQRAGRCLDDARGQGDRRTNGAVRIEG